MRLQLFFVSLLRVALTKSPKEVLGYLGESVTLPTGVDPSLNISTIIWSIFPNCTFIATYLNNGENLKWLSQYTGRLRLNISSGELEIHGLLPADAMEYTVQVKNAEKTFPEQKVKLIIEQHLQKPQLQKRMGESKDEGCRVALGCSSLQHGVHFTWQVHPLASASFHVFHDDNTSVILAFFNDTQVDFTCTASMKAESASSVLTESCHGEGEKQKTECKPMHNRNFAFCFLGIIVGVGLSLILYLLRGRMHQRAKL